MDIFKIIAAKALMPFLVKFASEGQEFEIPFYVCWLSGDVRDTDYKPVADELRDVVLEYIRSKTPTINTPPLPKHPDFEPGNYQV